MNLEGDICVGTKGTKKPSGSTNSERFRPRKVNMSSGAPSGTRTRDTLIKSQVLYQLS